MRSFIVIQHSYTEFLGTIEKQFEHREIGFNYSRPFIGDAIPGSPMDYDACICLGGPMAPDATADYPWLDNEVELIEGFNRAERPVVGFGLGGLLMVRAAGAAVSGAEPLHGAFVTAHTTEAGRGDPVAEAVDGQPVLVWHAGNAELPGGVEATVVDDDGRWLACRPGPKAYAMRFRPEIKPGIIEDMVMEGQEVPDNVGDILRQSQELWGQGVMQAVTDQVLVGLVSELGLMREQARKRPVFALTPGPAPGEEDQGSESQ
jgi:GMP synthase-like glutamine amidotransferase